MTRNNFIAKLEENDLIHHLEKFETILKPAIALILETNVEEDMRVGESKMGGRPDLPKSISWPLEDGNVEKPLSFIAQINLEEVARDDVNKLLPQMGLIYFFYSAEQDAWGFELEDKKKFRVLFYNGPVNELSRKDYPLSLPDYAHYVACHVIPRQEISIPYFHNEQLNFLTDEEKDRYFNVYDESTNKLLGYADPIQDEMELECELVTNGINCGDPSGYEDPRVEFLEPNAKDWQLLLQVDSNEENSMMWGDMGRLYFWIRKQELKNRYFDNCWCILQCS